MINLRSQTVLVCPLKTRLPLFMNNMGEIGVHSGLMGEFDKKSVYTNIFWEIVGHYRLIELGLLEQFLHRGLIFVQIQIKL